MIPYSRHSIDKKDIANVKKVLTSNFLTQGPVVKKFEDKLRTICGSKYAVTFNSATSALHIACMALGVKKGDIVWTSTNSFVASANCALYCQAKIDLLDINKEDFNLDISLLEKKLIKAKKEKKLPKVVIPIHFGGLPPDLEKLRYLKKKYKFKIIEDASHSLGAKFLNNKVGNCKYGDITVLSFHPVKIITTAEGGAATTNDKKIADKIMCLRSHGIVKDPKKFINPQSGSWNYEQQYLGFNYRITDIQAALGLSQLKRLDKIVEERNCQLDFYREILKDLPLSILEIPSENYSSVHLAVIRLETLSRSYYLKVFEGLKSNNIGVQLHYKPIYKNPYFKKFQFDKDLFPGAEEYEVSAISIPLYPSLKKEQQIKVKNVLSSLLEA